ncbi:MAG: SagB/ThcOx family dehydrogenase [Anaerolineae bacterium]|nr:SagB/ThcOx family dehydrogenase [Anaerolineae bacterium]
MKLILMLVCAGVCLVACASANYPVSPTMTPTPEPTRIPVLSTIALPTPRTQGPMSVEETMLKRRSIREFKDTPLTLAEIGQLLWAAQGITHPAGLRTAPSAGALYPLEVYAVTREATYRYDPHAHQLIVHARGDLRAPLYAVALMQDSILQAPLTIVITAVYARTSKKYGEERTPRYVALEVGHAAQNVLLQAVALNLGAVPIGAFLDDQVQQVLSLPRDHQPLYLIPVGHPR